MQFKAPRTNWQVEAHDAGGSLLWVAKMPNIVFDDGINYLLESFFKSVGYPPSWHVGLVNSPATYAASDLVGSHPGWTENVNYVSPTRPQAIFGDVLSKSLNNGNDKASFVMSSEGDTIAGVFLTSSSVKGSAVGRIYSAANFLDGPKTLPINAILSVTVNVSGA